VSRARLRGLPALVAVLGATALGQAKMVSGGDCLDLTSPCTCEDAPYFEVFTANQEKALEVWRDTQSEIIGGAASSFDDAKALFDMNFKDKADPRVLEPLMLCPDLKPNHIAGTSILGGGAELDDCFCKNVCQDIVESIIAHERTHVAFNIMGISYIIGVGTACAADLTDPDFCKVSNALLLSESEIQAHQIGNKMLREGLDKLQNPEDPEMECTWEPLPEPEPEPEPTPEMPEGFLPRLGALFERFVHGSSR
jgi:hypothetical protein